MTDRVRVVHVHHYQRPRLRPFRLVNRALGILPGANIVRAAIVFMLGFMTLHIVPGDQWGWGVGYECAVQPDGVQGVAAVVGSKLADINDSPPDPAAVRQLMEDLGTKAGEAWEGLSNGFKTHTIPTVPREEGEESVSDPGCGDCPVTGGTPVTVTGTGAELAARAVLAAGPGWADGGADAVRAVEIAGAESSFNPEARNSSGASGLFQIMMPMHQALFAPGEDWSDPAANARVAYKLWEESGWQPWVSSQGNWLKFHGQAVSALARVQEDTTGVVPAVSVNDPGVSDSGPPSKPQALAAAAFIREEFGFTGTIGGSATSGHITGSKHYQGLAIDVMVGQGNTEEGQPIADYFAGPGYEPFGVDNVIYNRRIFNAGRGWHDYPDRGNPTLNHEDHVHIDFLDSGGSGEPPPVQAAAGEDCQGGVMPASLGATTGGRSFAIASFNVLGSSHTAPGGEKPDRPSGPARTPGVVEILGQQQVDVVGFQEFQDDQVRRFRALAGGPFNLWAPTSDMENAIGWRTETFIFQEGHGLRIPYFFGHTRVIPVVKLVFKPTGQAMWFINTHNPADVHGPAGKWRAIAQAREFAEVRRLAGTGLPVFLTGDMNDHGFGQAAVQAGLVSAIPPGVSSIDWIFGTPGAVFRSYLRLTGPLVRATTDHPVIVAETSLGTVS